MDIIRNYLITMFMGLPDTPEVRRAREELEAMMEDKYSELLAEGKTENEAIGIVLSEFGNREELLQTLGISEHVSERSREEAVPNPEIVYSEETEEETDSLHLICTEEAIDYINASLLSASYIMTGVAMCIISPVLIFFGTGNRLFQAFAVAAMFLIVAGAVALFILSGTVMRPWRYVKKDSCRLEEQARVYVENEREASYSSVTLMRTVGIVLCILSVAPVIVFSYFSRHFLRMLGPALMFLIVAVGVAMIIYSTSKDGAYKKLLKLGSKRKKHREKETYRSEKRTGNEKGNLLAASYWEIVTAIYLCYSFLTFNWHSSWLIWVIAALFRKPVLRLMGVEVSADE